MPNKYTVKPDTARGAAKNIVSQDRWSLSTGEFQ